LNCGANKNNQNSLSNGANVKSESDDTIRLKNENTTSNVKNEFNEKDIDKAETGKKGVKQESELDKHNHSNHQNHQNQTLIDNGNGNENDDQGNKSKQNIVKKETDLNTNSKESKESDLNVQNKEKEKEDIKKVETKIKLPKLKKRNFISNADKLFKEESE